MRPPIRRPGPLVCTAMASGNTLPKVWLRAVFAVRRLPTVSMCSWRTPRDRGIKANVIPLCIRSRIVSTLLLDGPEQKGYLFSWNKFKIPTCNKVHKSIFVHTHLTPHSYSYSYENTSHHKEYEDVSKEIVNISESLIEKVRKVITPLFTYYQIMCFPMRIIKSVHFPPVRKFIF